MTFEKSLKSPHQADILDKHISLDTVVDLWQKMIDFTMKNQIRCEEDREYSIGEDDQYHFFAFSTQREIRKNENCFGWILNEFNVKGYDLALTEDTEAYFGSMFDIPMDVGMLIKEFYNIANEQIYNESEKYETPTDNDILRDIGTVLSRWTKYSCNNFYDGDQIWLQSS